MMKRTEKNKANSRQKSIANSRQEKSMANSRQEKSTANSSKRRAEPTAGKANQRTVTETRRSTRRITRRNTLQRKSNSQPVPKHPRTDANVQQGQQGQKELKLDEGIAKIPEINFNVEYKRIIQAAQQLKTATTSRKTPQRQHEDCMTKNNEVHLD